MTGFNSRARKGRDMDDIKVIETGLVFQFTRPQGARREYPFYKVDEIAVSIHAPARGATPASRTTEDGA